MQKTLNTWGLSSSIDLYGCNPESIRNPEKIKVFVKELCVLIKMKRYGETIVQRFGEGDIEGYSMFQFIETSSITAHFDEIENRAFLDIFSCKPFDPDIAAEFSKRFFEAEKARIKTLVRS